MKRPGFPDRLCRISMHALAAGLIGLGLGPAWAEDPDGPALPPLPSLAQSPKNLTLLSVSSATVAPHGMWFASLGLTSKRGAVNDWDGSLALGFGISGVVMVLSGSGAADPSAYITLVALAYLLSLAMLSVGFLISALTRKASVSVGIGLFLWLGFVFLGDLGMMGTSMAMKMPIGSLFAMSLTNPSQVFKMAAILNINATLDILGPAGVYAVHHYGQSLLAIFLATLALWAVVPAALAYARFANRGDL